MAHLKEDLVSCEYGTISTNVAHLKKDLVSCEYGTISTNMAHFRKDLAAENMALSAQIWHILGKTWLQRIWHHQHKYGTF